jgi:outer membrane protein TolC
VVFVAVLVTAGIAAHPHAQAQAPSGAPSNPATPRQMPTSPAGGGRSGGAANAQAAEAPVVRFAPDGIGLDEAVRLTLQYDPNLQRQLASASFQAGIALEQSGPFDLTLLGNVQYERRIQELSESRKQNERDKRDRLDQVIRDNASNVANAQRLLPLLDRLASSAPGQEPLAEIRAVDPSIADLLQVFNSLITSSTGETRTSLLQARQSFINSLVGPPICRTQPDNPDCNNSFQKSVRDQIKSYDDARTSRVNLGDPPIDEVFANTSLQIQLSKLFRSGILFQPFIDGASDGTNFRGKPQDSDFGGKGLKDQYTFHAGTGVNFPLLRGRGVASVAAFERAALIESDASRLNAQHQASVSSLSTVFAYWDLRASQENLAAVRRSSELQTNLLRLTQQLINGGELPGAELSRAQAADARARAQLEDAQRQLHAARVALAAAMGIAATGDDDTLPLARDPFPPPPDAAAIETAPALVEGSPEHRLDLSAAVKQQEAGQVIESAAAINVRPRLDLTTSTWFTAIGENSVRRSLSRWVGPSTQLALQFEKPLGNNQLRGQLAERTADARARQISAMDLRRQIRLGVLQASSTLNDAAAQVRQAEAAVGYFRNIYDADIQRYQTGEATLIDTVITEQQQTEALFALTSARNQLAHVLAQLRFQTGTLLPADNAVLPQNFVTMPPVTRVPR